MRIKQPYRWAQSIGQVFIKTKFTHWIDADSCEDVFDQKIKMNEKALNLTAKCRKNHETHFYTLYLEFEDKINQKESTWIWNETDGSIQITIQKQDYRRWPKLFKNEDGDLKPTKELIWVEKHIEHEKSLDWWREDNEPKWKFDHYDKLVTVALKREFPEEEPLWIEPVENTEEMLKPVDVTNDFPQPKDITEEMREKWDPETIKRILMNPNAYMHNPDHYNYDEIIEQEQEIKRKRKDKLLIDDEEEWGEDFEAKDKSDDLEIQAEELVEPAPLDEQCKA